MDLPAALALGKQDPLDVIQFQDPLKDFRALKLPEAETAQERVLWSDVVHKVLLGLQLQALVAAFRAEARPGIGPGSRSMSVTGCP